MQLLITPSGAIRCLYHEALDLSLLGPVSISRGSHVEPTPDGQWTVDLSPVHGPQFGPFPQRSQALEAEVAWLHQHWLVPG